MISSLVETCSVSLPDVEDFRLLKETTNRDIRRNLCFPELEFASPFFPEPLDDNVELDTFNTDFKLARDRLLSVAPMETPIALSDMILYSI